MATLGENYLAGKLVVTDLEEMQEALCEIRQSLENHLLNHQAVTVELWTDDIVPIHVAAGELC